MPEQVIQLKYSCKTCGITKRTVSVRARRKSEDVREWMDEAVGKIAQDHFERSPHCMAKKIDEMWIPLVEGDEEKGIGEV